MKKDKAKIARDRALLSHPLVSYSACKTIASDALDRLEVLIVENEKLKLYKQKWIDLMKTAELMRPLDDPTNPT